MQQIKNIVKGPYEPQDNTVVWIDTSNPDAPIAKVHSNGEWQATSPGEIVTEIDKNSTDEQIPTAKAVNDRVTELTDGVVYDLGVLSGDEDKEITEEQLQEILKSAILKYKLDGNQYFVTRVSPCDLQIVDELSDFSVVQGIHSNNVWGAIETNEGSLSAGSGVFVYEYGVGEYFVKTFDI